MITVKSSFTWQFVYQTWEETLSEAFSIKENLRSIILIITLSYTHLLILLWTPSSTIKKYKYLLCKLKTTKIGKSTFCFIDFNSD